MYVLPQKELMTTAWVEVPMKTPGGGISPVTAKQLVKSRSEGAVKTSVKSHKAAGKIGAVNLLATLYV